MIKYKDYDSLFERFCIMTVDGKLSDSEALFVLRKNTSKELYEQLSDFVNKTNKED